jgi:tetratricopeptide (TPR) repeat protein
MSILLILLGLLPVLQPQSSLSEGIQLYQKGEFQQAVNVLAQARDSQPAEPEIRFWLAKSYLKTMQWDNAVREMEKAVQLKPGHALYHLWLGRAAGAKASHSTFTAFSWARRVGKEFEKASKLAPEDVDVRFDLLEFYLQAPGLVGGGKEKAEAEAAAITKLDPRRGRTARSMVFQKNQQWDLAEKELMQATVDFPDYADSFKDLADFLLERKDFKRALQCARKAFTLETRSKRSQLIVAAAGTRLGTELDSAEKVLLGLAAGPLSDEDPAYEEIYFWLGQCYLAKGNKEKARAAFKSALAFNPEDERTKKSLSELK